MSTTSSAELQQQRIILASERPPSSKFEAVLRSNSSQAMQFEYQMKDLESKLAESLSNFRAIDSILQEAYSGLETSTKRADRARTQHMPHIHAALDECSVVLSGLSMRLPGVQAQIADIRKMYDSGRRKAQSLVADLEWLNTEWSQRFRAILFDPSAPVSWRWRLLMRTITLMITLLMGWGGAVVLWGAYRAHSQRLVWGERLMS